MVSFLKALASDQAKGSVFFSQVRRVRRIEIEESRRAYRWGAPDFKLYPSSLSFNMCPKAYIESLPEFNGIEDLTAIYRVKRGSAVHTELQDSFLKADKVFPRSKLHVPERSLKKLEENWPEVPFHDLDSGISGRVDGLMDWKGPVPVEIKTTSISPDKWEKHTETNLPLPYHLCQGAVYCYELNLLHYTEEPITRFILAYINLMMSPGDAKAEKEYVIDYEPLRERTTLLISHLTQVRNAFIKGEEIECAYPECKIHEGKRANRASDTV
jgi:hypothetical protein